MDKLLYYLVDNHLTPDPNDCRAVTQHQGNYTQQDLVDEISHRNVGLTRSQITSVTDEYLIAMVRLLQRGGKITTPMFTITPKVAGVFRDKKDSYDPSRHRIRLKMQPSSELKAEISRIPVEKTTVIKPQPELDTFLDMASDTDDTLTKGKAGRLFGSQLKCNLDDATQGIFLVAQGDGAVTRIANEDVIDNRDSLLTFLIPTTLAKGQYALEIRSKADGRDLRTVSLEDTLTVA